MFRNTILALISFAVVIAIALGVSPARAVQPNSVVYTWEYAHIGSNQLVCKQIAVYPKAAVQRDQQPVRIISKAVGDQRCAAITKPRV
ncbi:MAG: hypothetical protein HC910_06210 [Spirulinaceae cyanobacterium SM2_1_0]|nr:hypothetical protein [Spirulinaceae cyanobacterium SM2_1_0]